MLVVGSVHGNETAGIAVARALARLSPAGLDLWVVPDLNPDGVAAGTRGNAHGIDLNRNFPWGWRPLTGVYASGPRPLSERESRVAHRLILRLHPHVTIWFHQHLDLVWGSGGSRRIEQVFARVSGLPTARSRGFPAARPRGRTRRCRARPPSSPSCRPARRVRRSFAATCGPCWRPAASGDARRARVLADSSDGYR